MATADRGHPSPEPIRRANCRRFAAPRRHRIATARHRRYSHRPAVLCGLCAGFPAVFPLPPALRNRTKRAEQNWTHAALWCALLCACPFTLACQAAASYVRIGSKCETCAARVRQAADLAC